MAANKKSASTATKNTSSKDEQIGFHKGSLATLSKEREEMMRILSIVEQLMQMHIKALKEQGVDLESEAQKLMGDSAEIATQGKSPGKPRNKPPIEDII